MDAVTTKHEVCIPPGTRLLNPADVEKRYTKMILINLHYVHTASSKAKKTAKYD